MERASQFESNYASRVNTAGVILLAIHLPVLCIVAGVLGNSIWLAAWVSLVLLAGPGFMLFQDRASQLTSVVIGVAAMCFCALTIHICNGMIEAHFEIFALLALLTVFGRVLPLLAAAGTIAAHHVLFWLWLPASVFNYKASFSIVLLHAFFVIFEVIPACWIAAQFGRSIRAQSIVAEQLGEASDQVARAAAQVSKSSQTLALSASEQAASLEETSASTEEVRSMTQQNADNSRAAAELMTTTERHITEGNRKLNEMVDSMRGITQSSEKISKIIKTIDEIAFQTNILALNAAVEAARAGEAGMGFAVVADEVRNLAQRCTAAAKDTSSLIEESIARTSEGSRKLDEVSVSLSGITGRAERVRALVEEVSLGSQEQAKGLQQIAGAITQMEQLTQRTAANSEDSAAAGEQLNAQSESLRGIVRQLAAIGSQG